MITNYTVFADTAPILMFSKKDLYLTPDIEEPVSVYIKNVNDLYGIELNINFDPKFIELIDSNPTTQKIDIKPGTMLDPKKSFFLCNQINNQQGTACYTMSLLNPAPPVSGSGIIVELIVKAKTICKTSITIQNSKIGIFGKKSIIPEIKDINLTVTDNPVEWYLANDGVIDLKDVIIALSTICKNTYLNYNTNNKISMADTIFILKKLSINK